MDPLDPSIPFDCAQLLVLLLPPSVEVQPSCQSDGSDPSSSHWQGTKAHEAKAMPRMTHIEPKFRTAQAHDPNLSLVSSLVRKLPSDRGLSLKARDGHDMSLDLM